MSGTPSNTGGAGAGVLARRRAVQALEQLGYRVTLERVARRAIF